MWKLIITDSFHIITVTTQPIFYLIYFNFYINFVLRVADSDSEDILTLYCLIMIILLVISPIRLAKGLYLCPLSEKDRMNYLKMACFFRLAVFEALLAIVLIIIRQIYQVESMKLLLTSLCFSGIFLTLLLLSGFYNPEAAKQQYYIINKLTVPPKKSDSKEKYKETSAGNYMLIITLILSVIGMFLSFHWQSYHFKWLFYFIPAIAIGTLCMLIYFIKYFNHFIAGKANYEAYYNVRKKKVGVFHAD